MTLKDLHAGQSAKIFAVSANTHLRQHLLDMGFIPGLEVKVLRFAPLGDPMIVLVQGSSLTLRLSEAAKIAVEPIDEQKAKVDDALNFSYNLSLHEHNSHPGYGEEGKYHSDEEDNPLPKGTTIRFAIAGQNNCGKTMLFNVLTGANQHVGNFPGVTSDVMSGPLLDYPDCEVVDLPGMNSLSPYTPEEKTAKGFILNEKPHCIINVVDATNIERNLFLTLQMMEMGTPMVLALNMMDELTGNGGSVRLNELERELGIPVVPISATNNKGIGELVEHAVHVAIHQELPKVPDFCDKDDFGGALHRCLHSIMSLVEDHAEAAAIPPRFAASRIVNGDLEIFDRLNLCEGDKEAIERIVTRMEEERGLDRLAAMADMRYTFIRKVCDRTIMKPTETREYKRSTRIDKVVTGRWTAIPIFIAVMALVIWMSIDVLGAPLQDLLDRGITDLGEIIRSWLINLHVSPAIQSLVVDAVFGGVGTVISFVPVMLVLFFFLSILEDSGYMSRVAFVTDKALRRIGLSGRSIIPLLIGLGCSVPAVMAARTLPSARDRKKTILLTPFMSCSAKITIYAFLTSTFFPGKGGIILVGLYLFAMLIGVLVALASKFAGGRSEAAPFVMELPNYRLPRPANLLHLLLDKVRDFLQNAVSVILIATVVIWFLQSFDFHFNMVENGEGSMLAGIAGIIAPLFSPMGLGDWRIVTALITGVMAKETVVSSLDVLGASAMLTPLTAVPLLIFCLLYTPCIAAITAIKRELGSRWAIFVVVFQCVIAWICAFIAYLIAGSII